MNIENFSKLQTKFENWVKRTEISDVTDPTDTPDVIKSEITNSEISDITNEMFIKAIFQEDVSKDDEAVLVLSIDGDPEKSRNWQPTRFPGTTDLKSLNQYFAPSTFRSELDGSLHCKSKLANAIYCVVLDDVGVKASFANFLNCPPTWIIETSPGSHQVGYAFSSPYEEISKVESFKDLLIESEFGDPGASGAASRWSRLPVGINGKSKYGKPSPQCRLVWWEPSIKYSIDELITALNLIPSLIEQTIKKQNLLHPTQTSLSAKRIENPVVLRLKSNGLYKFETSLCTHEITCPWVNEHTDQVDHGTVYFEPSQSYVNGGFKCQHSHGNRLNIKDLLETLEVSFVDAKNLPRINVIPGEIPKIIEETELILSATGKYYVRGGVIVSLFRDDITSDIEVRACTRATLTKTMSILSTWQRFVKGELKVCDPTNKHLDLLIDGQEYSHLQRLKSIARQPSFRADGSVVTKPGYDIETSIYFDFEAGAYTFNHVPTHQDAKLALSELTALMSEFSFADEMDQSAAIAALITGVVRQSLKSAPMFHIKAPQIATGKSYLSDLIASFASPRLPSAHAYPNTEEECQKLLLALLINSPAVVIFDNLTTDLIPHNTMCSALTQEQLTGRILGSTKVVTVGTQVLFLSSGNNVIPIQDMTRRTITISLDSKLETPAAKIYVGNPVKTVRDKREHFVGLALTIVRAWILADRPITSCKPLNGYEEWCNLVRQPLLWLDLPDPVTRLFQQLEQDPGRETLGRLLRAWLGEFATVPVMIREVCQRADKDTFNKNEELRESLLEVAGDRTEINRRKLGHWISRNEGRLVGGLRFERAEGNTQAERWRVKSV